MLSLRSKSGHDEIVSASEIQTIAMAHASSLDAHKVHIYPPLSCNDYLCMCGGKARALEHADGRPSSEGTSFLPLVSGIDFGLEPSFH
jgi:hypothetical protein